MLSLSSRVMFFQPRLMPANATNPRPIQTTASTPRERTFGNGVELALRIAREAEGLEQGCLLPGDFLRYELTDAQHLVAVVGIGDDIDVVVELIENGEAVGSEAAKAARLLVLLVKPDLAFETLLTMGKHGAPGVNEIVADDEIRAVRPIGIDGDLVRIRVHYIRR